MKILCEKDGKRSFSRTMGAVITVCVLAVYLAAAIAGNWETVRAMTLELLGLAAVLYGVNKWGAARNGTPPTA